MRTFKIVTIAVAVLVTGLFAYARYLDPHLWPGQTRRESIHRLSIAKTPRELKEAATSLGAFITPTNGGWIAIRYRDIHAFGVQSSAIALDSEGRWFECNRHFCGTLGHAAANFAHEIELHEELKRVRDTETTSLLDPKMEDLIPLFAATDLNAVRTQMTALGFKEFKP